MRNYKAFKATVSVNTLDAGYTTETRTIYATDSKDARYLAERMLAPGENVMYIVPEFMNGEDE